MSMLQLHVYSLLVAKVTSRLDVGVLLGQRHTAL